MPLTHDFNETIRARAQAEPKFRQALLREAIECILNGELEVGRSVLRDLVNATVGFQDLEKRTEIPTKSLMRMLGPKGSPSIGNLSLILIALQQSEGVRFSVQLNKNDDRERKRERKRWEAREAKHDELTARLNELARKSEERLKRQLARARP